MIRRLFSGFGRLAERVRERLAFLGELAARIDQHHLFLLAGGITFSILVCILPLLLLIFAVLGHWMESESLSRHVDRLLHAFIPFPGYRETVRLFLYARIDEVIRYRAVAGYVGGLGLLFAASGLFGSLRTALNTIYGTTRPITLLLDRLRNIALVLVSLLVFLLSFLLVPFLEALIDIEWVSKSLRGLGINPVSHEAVWFLSLIIVFVLCLLLYNFIPDRRIGLKPSLVSATSAVVLWEIAVSFLATTSSTMPA